MTATNRPSTLSGSDAAFAGVIFGLAGACGLTWAGAALSALVCGHAAPQFSLDRLVALPREWRDPSAAWRQPVGPAAVYWIATVLVVVLATALAAVVWLRVRRGGTSARDTSNHEGLASRSEVKRAAGEKALLARAATLRPGAEHPAAADLGSSLGTARGVRCWSSCEDSMVILGPPRSGKGLHLVIPMILDAPGAVITTSTRPDSLTATLRARAARGPVAVFDPQGLAPGVPNQARWSVMRGCEHPRIAIARSKALTEGVAAGATEQTFWQGEAHQVVRCLLHAGALAGVDAATLYEWSLSPVAAGAALEVLLSHPGAMANWSQALNAQLSAEPKRRDSVWAMVGLTFACFADPHVLAAVSPSADEQFDPSEFLDKNGTVYLLGTSTGSVATAGLVSAFVEDVVDTARRRAARSKGGRLDPPLSLILDEAANYRLPSLASLMSDGGGTGVTTTVVLQSLAQARAVWGDHAGAALWDSAIAKVILGGGSNARDLDDLSRLSGTRSVDRVAYSVGPDGRRTHSVSHHDEPVLDAGRLRALPPGTAILMLRSARPIELTLQPWTSRSDADRLRADQEELEQRIRDGHDDAD